MRKCIVRSIFALLGATTALLAYASFNKASADPFGTGGVDTGREPDNLNHWSCWEPGGTLYPQALSDFFWIDMEIQTNAQAFQDNPCNSVTDVRYNVNINDTTSPYLLGLYTCLSSNGQGECEAARVNTNDWYYVNLSPHYYCYSYHNWCHESGHSLGLSHDQGVANCLQSGARDGCSGWQGRFTGHHINHVNNDIN